MLCFFNYLGTFWASKVDKLCARTLFIALPTFTAMIWSCRLSCLVGTVSSVISIHYLFILTLLLYIVLNITSILWSTSIYRGWPQWLLCVWMQYNSWNSIVQSVEVWNPSCYWVFRSSQSLLALVLTLLIRKKLCPFGRNLAGEQFSLHFYWHWTKLTPFSCVCKLLSFVWERNPSSPTYILDFVENNYCWEILFFSSSIQFPV